LGANVTVNYYSQPDKAERHEAKNAGKLARRSSAVGQNPLLVQGDVSQQEDVENLVAKTIEQFGSLDILVNNAGIQVEGPFPRNRCRRL
jgi:glucose 1-dehydrogenase